MANRGHIRGHFVRLRYPQGKYINGLTRGIGGLVGPPTSPVGRPEIVTNTAQAVVWRAKNSYSKCAVVQEAIGGLNLGFAGQYLDAERLASGIGHALTRLQSVGQDFSTLRGQTGILVHGRSLLRWGCCLSGDINFHP
jgi:hypothetical protein